MERKVNNKIIYLIVLVISILSVNVIPRLFPDSYRIIVFGIWFIAFLISKSRQTKILNHKNQKEKMIYALLIVIAYYIIYFALGIMIGFSNNPYPTDIISIIKNVVLVMGARCLQEFLRARLVNRKNKKLDYVIIIIIFAMLDLNIRSAISSANNVNDFIEHLSGTILTAIARSSLLTYFARVGGLNLCLIFSIPYYIIEFISPILPKLDWFVLCAKDLLLCLTLYLFINNIQVTRTLRISKRESKSSNPTYSIPILVILVLFVSFMVGLFEYKPIAVMSYSMYPEFSRGDVLIVKEIDQGKPGAIKVGDIIQYQLGSQFIVHRVVEIKIDYLGNFKFITKGDNNKSNDAKPVEISQIHGVAKFIVPYVGYPSVWFSQFLLNKQPVVHTE